MMWLAVSSPTLVAACGAGFHGGPHAADVALHYRGHQSTADRNALDDAHVGGLGHGVGRLDQCYEPFRFQ